MGTAHSNAPKAAKTRPDQTRPRAFSSNAFVLDVINRLAEDVIDSVITAEKLRAKTAKQEEVFANSSASADERTTRDLQVLSSKDSFFQWTLSSPTASSSPSTTPTSSSPSCSKINEDVAGLIANSPSRTTSLFKTAIEFFMDLRESSQPGTYEQALREANYPPEFDLDFVQPLDVSIYNIEKKTGFISRAMFFDVLRELLQSIYAGEDEDVRFNRQPVLNSSRYRLWQGPTRPNNLAKLELIVRPKLECDLGVCLTAPSTRSSVNFPPPPRAAMDFSRLPKLYRWTLRRKPWLDQLLEVEMRADEPTWLNYKPYIAEVVAFLVRQIAEDIFDRILSYCLETAKLNALAKK